MNSYILDEHGRHYRRKGGGQQNTLSNWLTSKVNRVFTESENRTISDRAWDLYLNGAYGKGLIEGTIIDTVGTGITPVFQPITEIVGDNFDTKKLTATWDLCASDPRKFFDYTKRMSLAKLQALAMFMWKIDGIGIFQVIYKDSKFSPSNISLKAIDSYYVKTPNEKNNQNIYDGIEVVDGKPVAIYIYSDTNKYQRYPIFDEETGLPLFLLVTDVRNIYEYRQDSILGNIIKDVKDAEESTDAVMVKFLISNLFTAFIKDSNFFDTYDGNPEYASILDRTVEMEKGTMIYGAKGEEPMILGSSDQPGPEYETMHKAILQRMGISTVRGAEILKREFNNSYSSARAALENAQRVDKYDISILNDNFNSPLSAWFTYDQILRGELPVSQDMDSVKRNIFAYSKASWINQPRIEIDQFKAAKVDTERLNNGTTTYSEIWAQRGLRPKEQFKSIVEEVKLIEEIEQREGVDLSFMKRGDNSANELLNGTPVSNAPDESD